MAGAVKELARLVPLEEDQVHLVNIVSRESERLNHIITDFLNYSREKTYEFQEADVAALLDETITLMEKKPEIGGNYQIARSFNGHASCTRAWMPARSSKCSGICATTRCGPCRKAERLPWLGRTAVLAADCVSRHRDRTGCETTRQDF